MGHLLADLFLWPGTKMCEYLGIDPTGDAGLIRSMFNMIIYLTVALAACWIVLA